MGATLLLGEASNSGFKIQMTSGGQNERLLTGVHIKNAMCDGDQYQSESGKCTRRAKNEIDVKRNMFRE